MHKTHKLLADYVNAATDLAESIRKDIQRNNKISEKTILTLNKFVIAANNISDPTEELEKVNLKLN